MTAAALNEAGDITFPTTVSGVAESLGQAFPETGFCRRVCFIARAWRTDIGSEVFVMGCVTHDVGSFEVSCNGCHLIALRLAADAFKPGAIRLRAFARCCGGWALANGRLREFSE
jgi:hypothetical protein